MKTKKYQISTIKKVIEPEEPIRKSYPLEAKIKKNNSLNTDDSNLYLSEKKIPGDPPRPKSIKEIKKNVQKPNRIENKLIFEKKIPNHQLTIKK